MGGGGGGAGGGATSTTTLGLRDGSNKSFWAMLLYPAESTGSDPGSGEYGGTGDPLAASRGCSTARSRALAATHALRNCNPAKIKITARTALSMAILRFKTPAPFVPGSVCEALHPKDST